MRLSELCDIQMGYTVRGRLEPSEVGGVKAIQMRDALPDETVRGDALAEFDLPEVPDRYWAGPGDVLFRSRGDRNSASVVDEGWGGSAVALLPLVLLRPKRDLVEPRYLAWAMNQPPAQRHFDQAARGTNMRMIPRTALDDLEIDLPDLKRQQMIVEIDNLARSECSLLMQKAEKKRAYLSALLLRAAQADQTKTVAPDA